MSKKEGIAYSFDINNFLEVEKYERYINHRRYEITSTKN